LHQKKNDCAARKENDFTAALLLLYTCFPAASLQMFDHLLEKKMTIEWEYGPVK